MRELAELVQGHTLSQLRPNPASAPAKFRHCRGCGKWEKAEGGQIEVQEGRPEGGQGPEWGVGPASGNGLLTQLLESAAPACSNLRHQFC